MALGRNLDSVVNDPLMTQSSTLLYSCLPPIWGTRGDDLLHPLYSWDHIWISRKRKQVFMTLKKRPPSKEFTIRNSYAGGLGVLAHHNGSLAQPVNQLLRF
jgi:hypothetical protein